MRCDGTPEPVSVDPSMTESTPTSIGSGEKSKVAVVLGSEGSPYVALPHVRYQERCLPMKAVAAATETN